MLLHVFASQTNDGKLHFASFATPILGSAYKLCYADWRVMAYAACTHTAIWLVCTFLYDTTRSITFYQTLCPWVGCGVRDYIQCWRQGSHVHFCEKISFNKTVLANVALASAGWPAAQTWSRGCQALVNRKKHWTRWQQGTTSRGDVEDMELSDTTQVTGDH